MPFICTCRQEEVFGKINWGMKIKNLLYHSKVQVVLRFSQTEASFKPIYLRVLE